MLNMRSSSHYVFFFFFYDEIRRSQAIHPEIETYHVLKVCIKCFNQTMNKLEYAEFVLKEINSNNEKERGISPINDFVVLVFHKRCLLGKKEKITTTTDQSSRPNKHTPESLSETSTCEWSRLPLQFALQALGEQNIERFLFGLVCWPWEYLVF